MKEEDFNKNNFTCNFNCLNDPQSKGKIEKYFKRENFKNMDDEQHGG